MGTTGPPPSKWWSSKGSLTDICSLWSHAEGRCFSYIRHGLRKTCPAHWATSTIMSKGCRLFYTRLKSKICPSIYPFYTERGTLYYNKYSGFRSAINKRISGFLVMVFLSWSLWIQKLSITEPLVWLYQYISWRPRMAFSQWKTRPQTDTAHIRWVRKSEGEHVFSASSGIHRKPCYFNKK